MCRVYPRTIQPQANYRKRMDFLALQKAYPSLVAVRLSEASYAEAFEGSESDGHQLLSSQAIGVPRGMSMNLLGGLFDIDKHLYFRPTGDAPCREDWDGESTYEVRESDYVMMPTGRFPLFYDVSKWHNYTFPYNATAQSEQDFIEKTERIRKIAVETGVEQTICERFLGRTKPFVVKARVKINHHPTLMNYWHSQLDCYSADSREAINNDTKPSSMVHKIMKCLKNELKINYQLSAVVDYNIAPEYYVKELTTNK
jgi:hypothetical protein